MDSSRQQSVGSVPFFAQSEYQCGPAALAGLLSASGVDTEPGELKTQIYLPARRGSLQIELLAASRRAGRIPYQLDPDLEALLEEIRAGHPVLVLQNLQTPQFPVWHYAVLTGYDPGRNVLTLNSGMEQGKLVGAARFLRTWNWGGNWAFITLRPGQLPAHPDIGRYLQSVVDFETVAGAEAAAAAWQAAIRQWPDNPVPWLALGNRAHASGKPMDAVSHFRRGLSGNPADPALSNNLAMVLGELGCVQAGISLLTPVANKLPVDSGWRPVILDTLEELDLVLGTDDTECLVEPGAF